MTFKPNLAAAADLKAVRYPLLASPKLDGIRAAVVGGRLLSRTLKEIPNRHIQQLLAKPELHGFDGELVVGDPWSKTCYLDTVSGVMSHDKTPDFRFYAFDLWHMPARYHDRWHQLHAEAEALPHLPIDVLEQAWVENEAELLAYEERATDKGFEGVILRNPNADYKFGRSTMKDQGILKLKRFEDSEAVIVGIEEEMFNGNEAQTNELGRTKRSTAQAGLIGKGTMGALVVRDVASGIEFSIGTGFTAQMRVDFWQNPRVGEIVKYKHFAVGAKDRPRHPVFLGMRPEGA